MNKYIGIILEAVKNFIKRNKDSLLKHWYSGITTDELKKLIKKV